jgi:hypothetical protein
MDILSGENVRTLTLIAGTNGVTAGDLVVISSGTVIKATDPVTADTLVGIALATAAADALVSVALAQDNILEAPYTGSSKTSLADTDIGTVFDLSDATTIDLDDTTGGCALCVGYDNDRDIIKFIVPSSFRYL